MEVNFDKEIDALLRQDGRGRTITISEFSAPHIDADELTAFAENALPQGARKLYMTHLADCDGCRKTLSSLVALNVEAEPVSAVSSVGVISPIVEKSIPWYKSLFAIQNLAYGMGGLVILFAGFIGYTLLQSGGLAGSEMSVANATANRSVLSQATEGDAQVFSANAAANSASSMPMAANSNASIAGKDPALDEASVGSAGETAKPAASPEAATGSSLEGADMARATQPAPPPSPVAAAPMSVPRDLAPAAGSTPRERDDEGAKVAEATIPTQTTRGAGTVNDQTTGPMRNENRNMERELGRTAAKRSAPAPTATRTIGGKTFTKRYGVWYDAEYTNQATTNVRRNTDAYRGLDREVRTIAESLDGTVVVVWKAKAYRIQ